MLVTMILHQSHIEACSFLCWRPCRRLRACRWCRRGCAMRSIRRKPLKILRLHSAPRSARSICVIRNTLARVVGKSCNIDLIIDDIREELRSRPYQCEFILVWWVVICLLIHKDSGILGIA